MKPFEWVSTGSITKFDRAVLEMKKLNQQLVAQGKEPIEITEARVKARYIEMNGLVMPVKEVKKVEEEIEAEEETPKKGRWAKKEDAE